MLRAFVACLSTVALVFELQREAEERRAIAAPSSWRSRLRRAM